jgi:hypothetical protein
MTFCRLTFAKPVCGDDNAGRLAAPDVSLASDTASSSVTTDALSMNSSSVTLLPFAWRLVNAGRPHRKIDEFRSVRIVNGPFRPSL